MVETLSNGEGPGTTWLRLRRLRSSTLSIYLGLKISEMRELEREIRLLAPEKKKRGQPVVILSAAGASTSHKDALK